MDNNKIYIEIHQAKNIIIYLNELEGIIKILRINDIIKENMKERITEIRGILKQATIKKESEE